jgi:hypothetical protein
MEDSARPSAPLSGLWGIQNSLPLQRTRWKGILHASTERVPLFSLSVAPVPKHGSFIQTQRQILQRHYQLAAWNLEG